MYKYSNVNNIASADYCEMYPQVQRTIVCSLGGYAMKRGWRSEIQNSTTGYTYQGDTELLPKPNPADCSKENKYRYESYKARAVVVEFSSRTKKAMLGLSEFKPHKIELPSSVAYLEDNSDNAKTPLSEQIKSVYSDLMDQGTGGLLVDIPSAEGNVSSEQIALGVRANIKTYDFLNIMKSGYMVVGAVKVLSYVLLRESITKIDVEMNTEEFCYQYRRLTLEQQEDGTYVYKHELLEDDGRTLIGEPSYPTDYNKKRLTSIPFYPIGVLNNSLETLDPPLLLPIAELNIGQYRNSADVEENAYQASQSTVNIFTDGVEDDFVYLQGASAVNTLGVDDKVELLQATESNLSDKLQMQKVADAVSVGASIIQTGGAEKKVEVVKIEYSANMASLSSMIMNTQTAYVSAIDMCQMLMSNTVEEFVFDLNVTFFPVAMTAEQITVWMEMIALGLAPKDYFVRKMVAAGEFPEEATEADIDDIIKTEGA